MRFIPREETLAKVAVGIIALGTLYHAHHIARESGVYENISMTRTIDYLSEQRKEEMETICSFNVSGMSVVNY